MSADKLIRQLRRMGGADRVHARLVAPSFSRISASDFSAGRAPNGQVWPPLKSGAKRTLHKSGALEAAATSWTANGRRVASAVMPFYFRYRNPRLFMPSAANLPQSYRDAIDERTDEAVQRAARGES